MAFLLRKARQFLSFHIKLPELNAREKMSLLFAKDLMEFPSAKAQFAEQFSLIE